MTAIQELPPTPPVPQSRSDQIASVVAAIQARSAPEAPEAAEDPEAITEGLAEAAIEASVPSDADDAVTEPALTADDAAPEGDQAEEVVADAEEVPEAVEAAAAPPDDTPSKRARTLAMLTRKERQLKADQARLVLQQAEAAKYRVELEAVKKDPIKYLEDQNPDFYSDYTQRKLNDGQPSPMEEIRRVRSELAEVKASNEALQQQAVQSQNDRIIAEARKDLAGILSDESFGYIRAYEADDEVFNLVALHYRRTGEDLPLADAANMIEQELESKVERLTKTKKFQSKLGTTKPAPQSTQKPAAPRTLTNGHTGTVQPVDFSKMDRSDKIKYLAAKIQAGAH